MRVHVGVVPGKQKSQTALVIVEHRLLAPEAPGKQSGYSQAVVHIEQLAPVLETIRERVVDVAEQSRDRKPCFFIDSVGAMGIGLVRVFRDMQKRGTFPPELHLPHAYLQRGTARQALVNAIVTAYGTGTLGFAEDLPLREDMIRALTTYESHVSETGRISYGGEEELVVALGLALAYPMHGAPPRYVTRDGKVVESRWTANDPYVSLEDTNG